MAQASFRFRQLTPLTGNLISLNLEDSRKCVKLDGSALCLVIKAPAYFCLSHCCTLLMVPSTYDVRISTPDNVNFCHQIEECSGPFSGSLWASVFNSVSHWLSTYSTYYGTRSNDSWHLGEGYVPLSCGQPHVTPPSEPDLSLLLLNPTLYPRT